MLYSVHRQPLAGQLYKYTNVMKGWQYRWFVLEPNQGQFEYFEREEHKQQQMRARGAIHLAVSMGTGSLERDATTALPHDICTEPMHHH